MDWNEDLDEDELRKTEMSGLKKAKQVHFENKKYNRNRSRVLGCYNCVNVILLSLGGFGGVTTSVLEVCPVLNFRKNQQKRIKN
jgi:hypothetical protein